MKGVPRPRKLPRYKRVMDIGCPIAKDILEQRWPAVEALARELLVQRRLARADATAAIERALRS